MQRKVYAFAARNAKVVAVIGVMIALTILAFRSGSLTLTIVTDRVWVNFETRQQ